MAKDGSWTSQTNIQDEPDVMDVEMSNSSPSDQLKTYISLLEEAGVKHPSIPNTMPKKRQSQEIANKSSGKKKMSKNQDPANDLPTSGAKVITGVNLDTGPGGSTTKRELIYIKSDKPR